MFFRSNTKKPVDKICELTLYADKTFESIIPIIKVFNITGKDLCVVYGGGMIIKTERLVGILFKFDYCFGIYDIKYIFSYYIFLMSNKHIT